MRLFKFTHIHKRIHVREGLLGHRVQDTACRSLKFFQRPTDCFFQISFLHAEGEKIEIRAITNKTRRRIGVTTIESSRRHGALISGVKRITDINIWVLKKKHIEREILKRQRRRQLCDRT